MTDIEQSSFLDDIPKVPIVMSHTFAAPPFTVLDARQGYWQSRKQEWIELGIKGELGRAGEFGNGQQKAADAPFRKDMINLSKEMAAKRYNNESERPAGPWRMTKIDAYKSGKGNKDYNGLGEGAESGTSIFDPVLCELMYTWFCPAKGHILDPFAGEATKGIVASFLGFKYTGIELRQEQVDVNYAQAKAIGVSPDWICGDSANIRQLTTMPPGGFDMIFTSPPYYDLEVYSESEADGSTMPNFYDFMEWYKKVFGQAVGMLGINRFLVVKIGEIRNKKGIYRNFLGENIRIFNELQLKYYNEAVLVTAVGSLPVRTAAQFPKSRKMGKGHQNILVFFKGDPECISKEFGGDV